MRTPRIIILVLFIVACLFIVCRAFTSVRSAVASYRTAPVMAKKQSGPVFGFIYYNTPFSLFPPNAAISLTDDNSTSFAARPAAFGPKLAALGLSGPLWIGSGFPDGARAGEGEMGCSDLPGWSGTVGKGLLKSSVKPSLAGPADLADDNLAKTLSARFGPKIRGDAGELSHDIDSTTNDEANDHLHADLRSRKKPSSTHADIRSGQEATGIEGKIVLLVRGGCGFLEKVMWAQRRGALAVIVGDNQKGGPLIQMFAHGEEVENVTIPSVFTARTTAHLLSSLTQPGSFIEDSLDDNGNPILKVQQGLDLKANARQSTRRGLDSASARPSMSEYDPPKPKRTSWVRRLLTFRRSLNVASRDVSSTRATRSALAVDDSQPLEHSSPSSRNSDLIDDVHDKSFSNKASASAPGKTPSISKAKNKGSDKTLRRSRIGIVGPGAGTQSSSLTTVEEGTSHPITSEIPDAHDLEPSPDDDNDDNGDLDAPEAPLDPIHEPHEGLWVTITPTSNASPFFDTLLVLVISPLVTLTIVYSLLILRARIRRRRWRAPKSVVERLPVRTYHTVAVTPKMPSPSSTSPTTPLLQHSPPRSRPRSRTTTGVMESGNILNSSSAIPTPTQPSRSSREHEKGSGGFSAEWRKYMGRQVECVVCLEEYVDGVSKVMSLPCGHEFHVDCITPWLTTRRRTCPICKGDVVRSLARGFSSGPRYEPYRDDSDDETVAEASGSRAPDDDSDLEQGLEPPSRQSEDTEGWMGIISNHFGAGTRQQRSRAPSPENRS